MAAIDIRLITGDFARFPVREAVGRFLLEGWYEAHEQAFVYQFLRPGGVFIDIGAHAGLYSVIAASRVGGKGRVIAVEPNPHIFPYLEANLQAACTTDLGMVAGARAIAGVALSDEAGEGAFNAGDIEHSAYARLALAADTMADTHVPTMTFDALVAAAQLSRIDLVKIDVEGAEHLVLAGAREAIARFPDLALMVEFTEENRERFGGSTEDLFAAADALGLKVGRVDMVLGEVAPVERGVQFWHQNFIMARDLALVEARLAGARESARLVAADFARKGDMARARYEESEALRSLTEAMAAPAARITQLRVALGAGDTGADQRLAAALENAAPAHKTQRLIGWLVDELARIEGDFAGVAGMLDEARKTQHEAVYSGKAGLEAIGRMIGSARGALIGDLTAGEAAAARVVAAFEADGPGKALANVIADLMDQVGQLDGAAIAVASAVSEARAQRDARVAEAEAARMDARAAHEDRRAAQAETRVAQNALAAARAEVEASKAEAEAMRGEAQSAHQERQTAHAEMRAAQEALAAARLEIDVARETARSDSEAARAETHAADEDRRVAHAEARAAQEALAAARAEADAARQAAISEAEAARREALAAHEDRRAAHEDMRAARAEARAAQDALTAIRVDAHQWREAAASAQAEAQAVRDALETARAESQFLRDEIAVLRAQTQAAREETVAARAEYQHVRQTLSATQTEARLARDAASASVADAHAMRESLRLARSEAHTYRDEAYAARAETDAIRLEIAGARAEAAAAREEKAAAMTAVRNEADAARDYVLAARQEVRQLGEAALELRRSRYLRLASALRLRSAALVERMVRVYTAEEPDMLH